MTRVIERRGTEVVDGVIVHDDRPSAFSVADGIVGYRLDRRRNYAIIDGKVCESVAWSGPCSGCYEDIDPYAGHSAKGGGCVECGYTGRSRRSEWVPICTGRAQRRPEPR